MLLIEHLRNLIAVLELQQVFNYLDQGPLGILVRMLIALAQVT